MPPHDVGGQSVDDILQLFALFQLFPQKRLHGVRDFLAKVPTAEFVELSDAGHTAAGDDNDAFSEAVVGFVKQ